MHSTPFMDYHFTLLRGEILYLNQTFFSPEDFHYRRLAEVILADSKVSNDFSKLLTF